MMWEKKNKYKAKRTGDFPSLLEAEVYAYLQLLENSGQISELKRQQTIVLQDGPNSIRIGWKVDFSYMENGELCLAEAKGIETNDYKLKLKIYRNIAPYKLIIWKKKHRIYEAEVIEKVLPIICDKSCNCPCHKK